MKRGKVGKQPKKMLIYNIFPLLAGKFTEWEKHLVRASDMGFNWIFVNPVQRPGRSGSIYAISDYYAINQKLVDEKSPKAPYEHLKEVIAAADNLGLKMMVDLVINHCSTDSDLITSHPNWFLWETKKRIAHPFADENGKKVIWKDLAKFNYKSAWGENGLFQFFWNLVKSLVALGFRGFRCDAAYQIPKSLWKKLINKTKEMNSEVLFFAETLGCELDETLETAGSGFDYIFNSSKWWDFEAEWLMEQYGLTREIVPSIGFPESHDTIRLCEELDGNIAGLKQRYLFAALFSAGVMIPMGYEFGFRKKLHVVKTNPEDWEETGIDLTPFISAVNGMKAKYAIFQEEAPAEILKEANPHILLMRKTSLTTGEKMLLILNKDIDGTQHFKAENLQKLAQAEAPLTDVSPEEHNDRVSASFSHDLRPGQGIVLVAEC